MASIGWERVHSSELKTIEQELEEHSLEVEHERQERGVEATHNFVAGQTSHLRLRLRLRLRLSQAHEWQADLRTKAQAQQERGARGSAGQTSRLLTAQALRARALRQASAERAALLLEQQQCHQLTTLSRARWQQERGDWGATEVVSGQHKGEREEE